MSGPRDAEGDRKRAGSARVLLVEDDPLIQMAAADMLADLGHAPVAVASAREALDLVLAGEAFDLVLTDHAMPGMSGLELARLLAEADPALPVVIATGYDEIPGDEARAVARLGKPYGERELAAVIARYVA